MLNALDARSQSETARKVQLARQWADLQVEFPEGMAFVAIAEHVTGILEERIDDSIKNGKTDAQCWFPVRFDAETWRAVEQEITPVFKARGYDLTAMPHTEHGFRKFSFLVSW